MRRADLVDAVVAANPEFHKGDAKTFYRAFVREIAEALMSGITVDLAALGKFKIVHKAARKRRNPRTGENVIVPPMSAVQFRPTRTITDGLNERRIKGLLATGVPVMSSPEDI